MLNARFLKKLIATGALSLLLAAGLRAGIGIDTVYCICGTGSPGGAELTAEGSAGPFTFYWEGPAGSGYESYAQHPDDFTAPGLYTVTVTNAYACATVLTVEVSMCAAGELLLETQPVSTAPGGTLCDGSEGGRVIAALSGGAGPFDYEWFLAGAPVASTVGGPAADTLGGLTAPGLYSVAVTDAHGCAYTAEAAVESLPPVSLTALLTPACAGGAGGAVEVTASGGAGAYESYAWSGPGGPLPFTGPAATGLAAGMYQVTVTDTLGCAGMAAFTLTEHPLPVIDGATITPDSCQQSGALALAVSGGASFTYAWSGPGGPIAADSPTLDGLAGGDYQVTVTNEFGCSTTGSFTVGTAVGQPATYLQSVVVTVEIGVQTDTLYAAEWVETAAGCLYYVGGMLPVSDSVWAALENGQGVLVVEATTSEEVAMLTLELGGQAPDLTGNESSTFSFTYFPSQVAQLFNNSETGLIVQLDFFSAQGLLALSPVDIGTCVPAPVWQGDCYWEPPVEFGHDLSHQISRPCIPLSIESSATGDTLTVLFDFESLSPPVSVNWTGPGSFSSDLRRIQPGPAGWYVVEVVDAAGCAGRDSIRICKPLLQLLGDALTVSPPCPGQSNASICLNSLADTWLVTWENGQTGLCMEGLSAGAQEVGLTVVSLTCQDTLSDYLLPVTIEPYAPLSLFKTTNTAACPGQNDALLCVNAAGGRPPYQFTWADGSTSTCRTQLQPGVCYQVTVTDDCGNSASQCFEFPAYQAPQVAGSTIQPSEGCQDGTDLQRGAVSLMITGTNGPFTYEWSGPGSFTGSHSSISDLSAGEYFVTVTDACGETFVSQDPLLVILEPAPAMNLSAAISASCGDETFGSIDLTVEGGVGSPQFTWNTGQTSEDLTGLAPGEYSVTVTDQSGCQVDSTFQVDDGDPYFFLEAAVTPACNGSVQVTVVNQGNGNDTFSYNWAFPAATSDEIKGLDSGTYCVTVTSGSGCAVDSCFFIPQENLPPEVILVDFTAAYHNGEELVGGLLAIQVDGEAPLSIDWSNGAPGTLLEGLMPGNYTVTVTDANGCQTVVTYQIPECVFSPPAIQSDLFSGVIPLSEPGGGAINISVTGLNGPFSYTWTGPDGFTSDKEDLSGLTAGGEYCVTVTDECGFETTECFFVQPDCEYLKEIDLGFHDHCLNDDSKLSFQRVSSGTYFSTVEIESVFIKWSTGESGSTAVHPDGSSFVYGGDWYTYSQEFPGREIIIPSSGGYAITVTDNYGCTVRDTASFYSEDESFRTIIVQDEIEDLLIPYFDEVPDGLDQLFAVVSLNTCKYCGLWEDHNELPKENYRDCMGNHFSFESNAIDNQNPCQAGGVITIENVHGTLTVVENGIAQFFQNDDQCGCLFPAGTYINNTSFPLEDYEYIWVDWNCGGSVINVDLSISIFDSLDCEVQPIVQKGEGTCTYVAICPTTGEIIAETTGDLSVCHIPLTPTSCQIFEYCVFDSACPDIFIEDVYTISDTSECVLYDTCPGCFLDIFAVAPPGDAEFSIFDEEGLSLLPQKENEKVTSIYPNPLINDFHIVFHQSELYPGVITLRNIHGKTLFEWPRRPVQAGETLSLELPARVPAGIYTLEVRNTKGWRDVHRIVVQR